MKPPTTKDGKPLKRIHFEGAEIWVLPHVDENAVIEKFKNRKIHPDWHTAGRLGKEYGTGLSSAGFSSDNN